MNRDHATLDRLQQPTADWPLFGLVDDIRPILASSLADGHRVAVATLVGVDGPSPRPLGSQMLVRADGLCAGYVSGGCVEASLALIAAEVLQDNVARRIRFGAGSPYMDIQLVCGSAIDVLVEPVSADDLDWARLVTAWQQRQFARHPVGGKNDQMGAADADRGRVDGGHLEIDDTGQIWRIYEPAERLIVIGRDPIALSLASLAQTSGLETVLIRRLGPDDPPPGFAGTYLPLPIERALQSVPLDRWTSVVTTTHDLDEDQQVLVRALTSDCRYVGALGSRRRLQDRLDRLTQAGLSAPQVARMHAPVGMNIGARSPGEIAVSILAHMIATRLHARAAIA